MSHKGSISSMVLYSTPMSSTLGFWYTSYARTLQPMPCKQLHKQCSTGAQCGACTVRAAPWQALHGMLGCRNKSHGQTETNRQSLAAFCAGKEKQVGRKFPRCMQAGSDSLHHLDDMQLHNCQTCGFLARNRCCPTFKMRIAS